MLYRDEKSDKMGWNYTEWRYWCECTSPDHVLCFSIDEDRQSGLQLEVAINSSPHMNLWGRIKTAFGLIFGKEVTYLGVIINKKDREELAKAIAGEKRD